MSAKILLVDDEPAVLSGYARILHREFEVETAVGGELGLKAIADHGPYAVIVSDMRMPGMSGSQFLAKAKELAPNTVRMLLTGFADLAAATEAVNEGNIFRFLTKPCVKEVFLAALNSGVRQHELIRAEKELLEKTLIGSIQVLADFLSASSPEAFGRSVRIAHIVKHVAGRFRLDHAWRLEAAATLSQLGCVTLDAELIQRAFVGMKLSHEDETRFNTHPTAAKRLLSGIPRLEPVAWMIGQQLTREIRGEALSLPGSDGEEIVLGAKILKLAVAFDDLLSRPFSEQESVLRLRCRESEFARELVDALAGYMPQAVTLVQRRLTVMKLATGMLLDQEVRNRQGMLLVSKGQEITRAILIKLENYAQAGSIDRDLMVLAPA